MLKGDQRSCRRVYPEGEECIGEALAGVIGCNLLPEHMFVVTYSSC